MIRVAVVGQVGINLAGALVATAAMAEGYREEELQREVKEGTLGAGKK